MKRIAILLTIILLLCVTPVEAKTYLLNGDDWTLVRYEGMTGDITELTSNIQDLVIIYHYDGGWSVYWPGYVNTIGHIEYGKIYFIYTHTAQGWDMQPAMTCCRKSYVHEINAMSVSGHIGNLSVEADKEGMAGIEATANIITANERITVEVLAWYEDGEKITGVTIYDYNRGGLQYNKTSPADGLMAYSITINQEGIETIITGRSGEVFRDLYQCEAIRITELQTELEYWRLLTNGNFNFKGVVSLEKADGQAIGDCNYYEDTFTSQFPCCEFLDINHFRNNGFWILEGVIMEYKSK